MVKPVELAYHNAGDDYYDAVEKLINTVPTTATGLAAMVLYVRDNKELYANGVDLLGNSEFMVQLLATIAKSARALAGLPAA